MGIEIGLVGSSLCSGKRPGKFRALQINTPVNPQGLIERSINSAFGMVLLRKRWTYGSIIVGALKCGML